MQDTQNFHFHTVLVTVVLGICLFLSPASFANTSDGNAALGVSEFLRGLSSEIEQIEAELQRVDDEAVTAWFDNSLKEEAEAAVEAGPAVADAAHERWLQVVEMNVWLLSVYRGHNYVCKRFKTMPSA